MSNKTESIPDAREKDGITQRDDQGEKRGKKEGSGCRSKESICSTRRGGGGDPLEPKEGVRKTWIRKKKKGT